MFDSLEDLEFRLSATGYFIDPVTTQVVCVASIDEIEQALGSGRVTTGDSNTVGRNLTAF